MGHRDFKRSERVAEQLKAEIMNFVLRGAIRDPNAQGVLVSDVRVTDDLGEARVYLRLQQDADEERKRAAVDAMTGAAGFLRRELGRRLRLRKIPELVFFWDEVPEEASRIESLLEEIRQERDEEEPE